jgi:hypothetical protein
MNERNKPRVVGRLAGEPLYQSPDGSYRLTLRQSILLTLEADTKPARAVASFVNALAEAVHGPNPSQTEKIDVFAAWLRGGVKGQNAVVTSMIQTLAEGLHAAGPALMGEFYAAPEAAMSRKTSRKQLAQAMLQTFWTSGPLGPGECGENIERLVAPMLLAVRRQFPEATADDWNAMFREMARGRIPPGPSYPRLGEAALYAYLERMVTKCLEAKIREGKLVREIDPETGEAVYRSVDKPKGEAK